MDRSLKERVIGASVLVALAVWLIPWVLDGPVPDTGSGAAQAPAAEGPAPLRTQTIRLDNRQNTSAQDGAPDIPGSTPPRDSGEVAEIAPDVPAGASPNAPADARPDAPDDARPAAPGALAAEPANAEASADAPSGGAVTVRAGVPGVLGGAPAPAASGLSGSSESPVPAQAVTGWLVQVGSFGDEENARRQADRLADAGFTARLYPHTSGGRRMYRVRVGPEPSREGADEIASSLRNEGFVADVVASD